MVNVSELHTKMADTGVCPGKVQFCACNFAASKNIKQHKKPILYMAKW